MTAAASKTTFILSDVRRARLKAIAIERGTTVTDLLAEGAELVIERYQSLADSETLAERARAARERLRRGLYEGPSATESADGIVYGLPRGRKRKQK